MLSLIRNPLLYIVTGGAVLLFVFISPVFYSLQPCSDGICLPHPEAKNPIPAAVQRVTQRYGPYTVPGIDEASGMADFEDALSMPCSDCFVTYMHAGLEYPDGSYANADTGMWLHHLLVYNLNRTDTTCPKAPQRAFASGNERTVLDLTLGGTVNAGYYVGADDEFALGLELMNEVKETRDAILTLDWGYITGAPADFHPLSIVWLDVDGANGCDEDVKDPLPPKDTMKFSLEMSNPWTMATSGQVILTGGHLHDGGVDLQVIRNGETVCDSAAEYGESPGYVDAKMMHISSMSTCSNLMVEQGDEWWVRANYDVEKYSLMMEGPTPAPVMGISILYIVQ